MRPPRGRGVGRYLGRRRGELSTPADAGSVLELPERIPFERDLAVVVVQGLGFVGSAMAAAVADAHDRVGRPYFNVIGIDLPTPEGIAKVEAINAGEAPIVNTDLRLEHALAGGRERGNLVATTDERLYALASVVVVDVPLDVVRDRGVSTVDLRGFRQAVQTLGRHLQPGSLVIVETTVPPGTTDKIAASTLADALAERGLPEEAVLLAYSFERVMPGPRYLDSIINLPRCYAGHTPAAADACEAFLSKVIDTRTNSLTRLQSTTACETAKVLENTYRATTIALMEEWGQFAEVVGVDLFEVVDAIRRRPTHANMRQPGFGVGGYCLTKDPLLGQIAARDFYGRPDIDFPFSTLAVAVNEEMPLTTLEKVENLLGGRLSGKSIVLMGVAYRPEVGDTRNSPSETFVREARKRGASVICHDPLVREWRELEVDVLAELPPLAGVDAVVFAVQHSEYAALDLEAWLADDARPVVVDGNDVLTAEQRSLLRRLGCAVGSIGRSDRA
jgi:UDP-N-acetyl-D-glucosamine dehydrogenase